MFGFAFRTSVCALKNFIQTSHPSKISQSSKFIIDLKLEIPKVYKDRQKHVQDMCDKYHDKIVANLKLYSHQSFEKVVTKAEVLYSTNNVPFLWCRIPKVASQSWTDLFVQTW